MIIKNHSKEYFHRKLLHALNHARYQVLIKELGATQYFVIKTSRRDDLLLDQSFPIQHKISKYCWYAKIDGMVDTTLTLSQTCTMLFDYTAEKNIIEIESKMCLKAKGLQNNAAIILSSECSGEGSKWEWNKGFLELVGNGRCIHIQDSDVPVREGKLMVLHEGCDHDANAFERL